MEESGQLAIKKAMRACFSTTRGGVGLLRRQNPGRDDPTEVIALPPKVGPLDASVMYVSLHVQPA